MNWYDDMQWLQAHKLFLFTNSVIIQNYSFTYLQNHDMENYFQKTGKELNLGLPQNNTRQ